MKLIFVLIFTFFSTFIFAQKSYSIYIENMNKVTSKTVVPNFTAIVMYTPLSKQFGMFLFTQTSVTWSQFLVGVTYQPKQTRLDVCKIRFGVGIEQDKTPVRFQAGVFITKKNFSLLSVFEYGGSGPFYLFVPTYKISHLLVGIRAHKFYGIGPMIGYTSTYISIWGSPMYEIEKRQFTGTATFSVSF